MNQQSVELLAYCAAYFEKSLAFMDVLYWLAKWSFILAIGVAVLVTFIDFIEKIMKMNDPDPAERGAANARIFGMDAEKIKAATAFVAGLAKAPVWFFLFLAGVTLVWLASIDAPEMCEIPRLAVEASADQSSVEKDVASEAVAETANE